MPQFARPEFSVFQCGVSSRIAVTTYLTSLCVLVEFFDDGDAHGRMLCGLRRRILGDDSHGEA